MNKIMVLFGVLTILQSCASLGSIDEHDLISPNTIAAVAATKTEYTEREEYEIGRPEAASIIKQYGPYDSPKANKYVELIGQVLALHSPMPRTFNGYNFMILDSNEIRTFSAPGGFIFLTRGLLEIIENEDMLAAALSYPVAYVALRIEVERKVETEKAKLLIELANEGQTEMSYEIKQAFGDIVLEQIANSITEKQVFKADAASVEILTRSGYDAEELYKLFALLIERNNEMAKGEKDNLPSLAERQSAVKRKLEEIPISARSPTVQEERRLRFKEALDRM